MNKCNDNQYNDDNQDQPQQVFVEDGYPASWNQLDQAGDEEARNLIDMIRKPPSFDKVKFLRENTPKYEGLPVSVATQGK